MRAFIAIEISEEIKGAIALIEDHLKYAGADVKWVKPEIVHLTLKFLGEITDEKRSEIESALDEIAQSARSFELTVKEIGAFPAIEHPRVIWVGLDRGSSEASDFAKYIESLLSKLGFAKEERAFSPHLTIGRVRSSHNKDKLKEKISSASSKAQLSSINPHKVTSLILFQSTLTPQGPVYTKLHEAYLKG